MMITREEIAEILLEKKEKTEYSPDVWREFPAYYGLYVMEEGKCFNDSERSFRDYFCTLCHNILLAKGFRIGDLIEKLQVLKNYYNDEQEIISGISRIKDEFFPVFNRREGVSVTRAKIKKSVDNLPDWNEFVKYILQPIEVKISNKDFHAWKRMNEILAIYGLEYDKEMNLMNFQKGRVLFNQMLHEKHSSISAQYPHNSIVDIKLQGIIKKDSGDIIRKPWVVTCFAY